MDIEIREEIDSAVEYAKEIMPQEIRDLIGLASYDLWHGPIWLDSNGEACSGYDDNAVKQFDFGAACAAIGDWLDSHVSDIQIEVDWDSDTEESVYEYVTGSGDEIRTRICGKLAEYI